jgi:hypothetical protein
MPRYLPEVESHPEDRKQGHRSEGNSSKPLLRLHLITYAVAGEPPQGRRLNPMIQQQNTLRKLLILLWELRSVAFFLEYVRSHTHVKTPNQKSRRFNFIAAMDLGY